MPEQLLLQGDLTLGGNRKRGHGFTFFLYGKANHPYYPEFSAIFVDLATDALPDSINERPVAKATRIARLFSGA
jgi:hypothetical protein